MSRYSEFFFIEWSEMNVKTHYHIQYGSTFQYYFSDLYFLNMNQDFYILKMLTINYHDHLHLSSY